MSLKCLFVRNNLKTEGKEEGGRQEQQQPSLKVLWVEMLLQLSCIPFHWADVNSCKRSPGCSLDFAVIADSRSYSGMPPAGIFPVNYPRDELLCGHISSQEAKRQSWPFQSFSVNVLLVSSERGCPEALWKVQLCKGGTCYVGPGKGMPVPKEVMRMDVGGRNKEKSKMREKSLHD